jgi:hypothetical protein
MRPRSYAWNTLIDQPWKIMSTAQRDWATVGQSYGYRHRWGGQNRKIKIAEIAVPGEPLASFDISYLDQAIRRATFLLGRPQ